MRRAQTSRAKNSLRTLALVLRRTPYRDSDLMVTLFTEQLGQVSALARAARNSRRRFGGSLEPFHTLEAALDETRGSELLTLTAADVVVPRTHLYEHLPAMEAAGRFLGWVRHATPAHTPEPLVWQLALGCLDELDAASAAPGHDSDAAKARALPALVIAARGLQLLSACGWRVELERCVLSGAPCPAGKAAMVDPERGGLVSRAEGGAPLLLGGALRGRLILAQSGRTDVLEEDDGQIGLELVERCLRAHAGFVG